MEQHCPASCRFLFNKSMSIVEKFVFCKSNQSFSSSILVTLEKSKSRIGEGTQALLPDSSGKPRHYEMRRNSIETFTRKIWHLN